MIDFVIVMATIFTFFILPVYVFAAWKERNKRKQELSRNLAEKSLTTAELESMIGDIVRSAMTEVEDRLARLEVSAEMSIESSERLLSDQSEIELESSFPAKTVGRTHS